MTAKSKKSQKSKPTCSFCNKTFVREKTLLVHQCEKKRRYLQRDEVGPRLGLTAFNIFLEHSLNKPPITKDDFINSSFYTAFVKFGWYVHEIRPINFEKFVIWLLKNQVKIDWWTKDRYYEKFASEYMLKETPAAALERSINEMDKWAYKNNTTVDEFFRKAPPEEIYKLISNGRISPWLLYNCDYSIDYLANLPSTASKSIMKWIDPDKWSKKFAEAPDDVQWVREVLDETGFNKKSND